MLIYTFIIRNFCVCRTLFEISKLTLGLLRLGAVRRFLVLHKAALVHLIIVFFRRGSQSHLLPYSYFANNNSNSSKNNLL